MTQKGIRKFIGTKEFYKLALSVALPLMFQQLISTSVNLLDNIMIGQLGDASLGGVAAVNRYYMISIFASNGILATSAIYIAQFFGAKDEEHMKQSFRFSVLASYAFAIISFALGLLFPEKIVQFFTDDPLTIAEGIQYIKIVSWTFLPIALSMAIGSSMRAVGESHIPLRISSLAMLVNGTFNYILIFGHLGAPAMGVQGAAYATLLARIVEAAAFLYIVNKKHFPFLTKIKDLFHIQLNLAKTIVVKAAPLVLNEILWSSGMAVLFKFYATRGSVVLSGYSISGTVADLFFSLFGGMAVVSTIMISQPLGADKLDEARENAYRILGFSMILAVFFGFLMFTISFVVPYLYNVSAEAMEVAVSVLRIMSFMFWVYMANTECYFILRAGGDMKSTLYMDSFYMWGINLPIVGLFCYFTDIPIILLYLIGQSTDIVKLVFSYWLVKKENWVNNLTTVVSGE